MSILPEYDGTESLSKYLGKVKEIRIKQNIHKYEKILEFINLWLAKYKIKLKSLTDFKKISEKVLLSNEEHNKKILDKYYDSLISYLDLHNICYNSDNSSTDSYDKFEREYQIKNNIISFIKEILAAIDYTIIMHKTKNNNNNNKIEISYSIKINT